MNPAPPVMRMRIFPVLQSYPVPAVPAAGIALLFMLIRAASPIWYHSPRP